MSLSITGGGDVPNDCFSNKFCDGHIGIQYMQFAAKASNIPFHFGNNTNPGGGGSLHNGSWSGIMKQLNDNKTDVTLPYFRPSFDRTQNFHCLSSVVFFTDHGLVYNNPHQNEDSRLRQFAWWKSFHPIVWVAFVGTHCSELFIRNPSRPWLLAASILDFLFDAYFNNLLLFLFISQSPAHFTSWADVAKQVANGHYTWLITHENAGTNYYFSTLGQSDDPSQVALAEALKLNPIQFASTNQQKGNLSRNEKGYFVYLDQNTAIKWKKAYVQDACWFKISNRYTCSFVKNGLDWRKREDLNRGLQRALSIGLHREDNVNKLTDGCDTKISQPEPFDLILTDFAEALYFLLAGSCVSLAAMFFERYLCHNYHIIERYF